MKHLYWTTRPVVDTIRFVRFDGVPIPEMDTRMDREPGAFIFRGGKRDFAKHLEALNKEHGAGYAIANPPG